MYHNFLEIRVTSEQCNIHCWNNRYEIDMPEASCVWVKCTAWILPVFISSLSQKMRFYLMHPIEFQNRPKVGSPVCNCKMCFSCARIFLQRIFWCSFGGFYAPIFFQAQTKSSVTRERRVTWKDHLGRTCRKGLVHVTRCTTQCTSHAFHMTQTLHDSTISYSLCFWSISVLGELSSSRCELSSFHPMKLGTSPLIFWDW